MTPRATPMPPDERRRAIVAAAIPLVRDRGFDVSTAEVARAAGVAEGTLFRAFATKAELFRTVTETVMDPVNDIADLDAIDRTLPLADRVRLVIEQWTARVDEVSILMAALQSTTHCTPDGRPRPHDHDRHREDSRRLNDAVARLLAGDADVLRVSPATAARFIRSAIFAARHPMLGDADSMTTDDLVDLLLHGITLDEGPPC